MSAGTAAALGQALVPFYTGKIIDYASIEPDSRRFQQTTLKLVGVAFGCAVFTGIPGVTTHASRACTLVIMLHRDVSYAGPHKQSACVRGTSSICYEAV